MRTYSEVLHQEPDKANFDPVCSLEDPRKYFETFRTLDYCISRYGQRG